MNDNDKAPEFVFKDAGDYVIGRVVDIANDTLTVETDDGVIRHIKLRPVKPPRRRTLRLLSDLDFTNPPKKEDDDE